LVCGLKLSISILVEYRKKQFPSPLGGAVLPYFDPLRYPQNGWLLCQLGPPSLHLVRLPTQQAGGHRIFQNAAPA
jgi:hypothetical protein